MKMAKSNIKLRTQKRKSRPFEYDRFNQSVFDKFQEQAPDGNYEVTYKRKLPDKTHSQTKTVFGLLINKAITQASDNGVDTKKFLKFLLEDTIGSGVELDDKFLYAVLLKVCPIYDEDHKNKSLSGMDIEEASRFFKNCQAVLATTGIDIPDPNKNWKEVL